MLSFLKNLLCLLVKHVRRYDMIIVSGAKTMPQAAVLVSRIWHKKCVLRVESPTELHESISTGSLHNMNRLMGRMLLMVIDGMQQFLFKRVDCFIAISPEIHEALTARGIPPRQIQEIPNGIDLRVFHPVSTADKLKLRQKLSIPHDKTVFIYTGRLSAAKGLPLLIEVWSTLIVQYPDMYLVLLGSSVDTFDSCEAYLHAYIQTHHLMASVTLAGASDRVDEYLQAADVFVFPSEYEGFGLSIIEAMACGLPVVVTPVGVARELIEPGKNGFVFPVNNKQALLGTLVFALEQREYWPMIVQAAQQSIKPYDLQVVINQYMTLCCELLGAASASSKD
jgi:glycosyltransferase involved in cell wall biosynthesis